MSKAKAQDFGRIGLCIKSVDATVEYQNETCKKICGQNVGKKCEKGCVLKLQADQSDQIFKSGFKIFRNMPIDQQNLDCVIAQNSEKIITLIMSNQDAIQKQLDLIKTYGLTKSEINIIEKFLEGHTNQEIASNSLLVNPRCVHTLITSTKNFLPN